MTLPVMDSLRTYSPEHRRYIDGVLCEIVRYYGENLLGLAVFGSFARGENRKGSDLDLLVILKNAAKRRIRLAEFIHEIEMKHDGLAQQLFKGEGLLCEISPYILSESEAMMVQPIYYDLVTHHVIVWDPQGIIAHIVDSTAALLREVGARRVRRNNTWEWRTNRAAYLDKAAVRMEALSFYRERQAYSDVVREAQSVVELTLKALLRAAGIEVPKIHDVGRTLEDNKDLLPAEVCERLVEIRAISKRLRKERELSFDGAEDFVPTEEYELADADQAIDEAHLVLEVVRKALAEAGPET